MINRLRETGVIFGTFPLAEQSEKNGEKFTRFEIVTIRQFGNGFTERPGWNYIRYDETDSLVENFFRRKIIYVEKFLISIFHQKSISVKLQETANISGRH